MTADPKTLHLLCVFEAIVTTLRNRVLLDVRDPLDEELRTQMRSALFAINEHLVEIPERWACEEGPGSDREFTMTGPTVDAALERCYEEGLREAKLRLYRVALPTSDMIDAEQFVENIDQAISGGLDEVDFANWEEPLIQASPAALADLEARLTVAVRWWAQSHGCHKPLADRDVSIYAWQFYGDPRMFVWDEDQGQWRETTSAKEPS